MGTTRSKSSLNHQLIIYQGIFDEESHDLLLVPATLTLALAGSAALAQTSGFKSRAESIFGLHFDLHPNLSDPALGADVTEERVAKLMDMVKPDYVQYRLQRSLGLHRLSTEVGWSAPHIVKDSLAIWRKVTSEHSVGLFIHYSGVWDAKAIEEHPDWGVIGADGKPDAMGDDWGGLRIRR